MSGDRSSGSSPRRPYQGKPADQVRRGPRDVKPVRPERSPLPARTANTAGPRVTSRTVALEALRRVDDGAYVNLVLPKLLTASGLDSRDRALATELTYGTVRRRRAVDWLVNRHADRDLDIEVRRILHLGTYQLAFARIPAHAAVSEMVDLAPGKARGFCNAVLRRVAEDVAAGPIPWPDMATALSYPDWIVDRLTADLGAEVAEDTLVHLDEAPTVNERADGYNQDLASQWVAAHVGAQRNERVLDVCAAPGGKSTYLGKSGATVIAADVRPHRVELIAQNVRKLVLIGAVIPVLADGLQPPFAPGSFDRVLLDAPCSGLGVLHRRPDARWRITAEDIDDLVVLQRTLIEASIPLVRPGGVFIFSACTLTLAESLDHDEWLARDHPELVATDPPGDPWEPLGRGARLLPQTAGTDGMVVFSYRVLHQ